MRRITIKIAIAATGVLLVAVAVLFSGIFAIGEISVVGNYSIADDEILARAAISRGQNILGIPVGASVREIESHPFVQNVRILRDYPDRVVISIIERTPIAYTRFFNTYLLIDASGMVLETAPSPRRSLPGIIGLDIAGFTVGEYLDLACLRVFDSIIGLSRYFSRHYFDEVLMVDAANPLAIRIYTSNLTIFFGSMDNADRKIQDIAAIIAEMPIEATGAIHIDDPALPPRFAPSR